MKSLLLTFFFLVCKALFSQNPHKPVDDYKIIDSLKIELSKTKEDSLRTIISLSLAKEYLLNRDKANFTKFYNNAIKYSNNNSFLKDLIFFRYSGFYMLNHDYDGFIKHLDQADKRLSKYNHTEVYKIRTNILLNKSIYFNNKNKTKSINILMYEVLPLANKIGDYEIIVQSYKSIAIKFYNEKNNPRALKYIVKALDIYTDRKIKNKGLYIDLLLLQSEVLTSLKKFNESLNSLDEAYNLINRYPNSDFQGIYYYTKGFYFHELKKYNEAINNFDYGIEKAIASQDVFMENRLKLMKVMSLKGLQKYQEAKIILNDLLNNKNLLTEDKIDYLKELASLYKKLNDLPNSLKAYEEYVHLNDSFIKNTFEEKSAYLEKELNEVEKNKKINELNYEKERAKQSAINSRQSFIISLLILGLLIVILIIFWLSFVKIKKLNREKELSLNEKINALKREKELTSLYAMMEGEENERKRIARDLHDGLGGSLSSIKMRMERIAEGKNDTAELSKINILIDNSIKELRQVAYNLVPETLLKLGLDQALHDLCINYSSYNIAINYHSSQIDEKIIKPHQITIYRIIQELIHNIIKHSKATHAIVECSQNENLFLITVEDNGQGFNKLSLEKNKGIGLRSLKNRIELLDGKLEINSNESEGTNIYIELFITMNS